MNSFQQTLIENGFELDEQEKENDRLFAKHIPLINGSLASFSEFYFFNKEFNILVSHSSAFSFTPEWMYNDLDKFKGFKARSLSLTKEITKLFCKFGNLDFIELLDDGEVKLHANDLTQPLSMSADFMQEMENLKVFIANLYAIDISLETQPDRTFDQDKFSNWLGIAKDDMQGMMEKGQGPKYTKMASKTIYTASDIKTWLKSQ